MWAPVLRDICGLLRGRRRNRLDFEFRDFSEHLDQNYVTGIFMEPILTAKVATGAINALIRMDFHVIPLDGLNI